MTSHKITVVAVTATLYSQTYPGMVGGAVEEVTSLEHNVYVVTVYRYSKNLSSTLHSVSYKSKSTICLHSSQFKMTTEQALIPQLACLLTADHVRAL